MNYQDPAEGLSIIQRGNGYVTYRVSCDCSDPDHDVHIDVDRDEDFGVQVTVYTKVRTPFWDKKFNRFKVAWNVLWKGYHEYESNTLLRKQAAYNVANAIKKTLDSIP